MQYVNDDMDELFKRAAENYPLDTNSADWTKVLAALQNETGTKTISEQKRNKNGRFLWLLLLLPIGIICNQLYRPGSLGENAFPKTDAARNMNSGKRIKSQPEINNGSKIQNVTTTDLSTTLVNSTDYKRANPDATNDLINLPGPSIQTRKKSNIPKSGRSKTNTRDYNYYNEAADQRRNSSTTDEGVINNEMFSRSYVFGIPHNKKSLDGFSTSVKKDMNPLFETPKSKENIQVAKRKKFYAGLMGGVDVTTIKFQKIEDAGFSYGMLAGYQLNKKWSVETGVFLERKYYYSDGKYFNTSKIYLPANTWIDDASGNCKMIEVPLAVKYNFSVHKNSNWFATLGVSSYFMKQENYTYNYYYGTFGPVPHQKEYKNSSTDLFSAMSISAGYNHRLGNFADLRIEPYLKLPIYGMGIGKLPFLSTGLQIGVTKKF